MPTYLLDDRDRVIIDPLLALFNSQQRYGLPLYGDMVEVWHPEKGKLYDQAHIQQPHFHDPDWISICTHAYIPYCSDSVDNTRLTFDASGGYWREVDPAQLATFECLGQTKKMFWTWNHRGVGAGNGVYFWAIVMKWKYTDERFY